jgi:glycosyltransferase involved in cell wall biosynthesis
MKPYLSIIIPAFNEEKNLQSGVLEQMGNYLNKVKYEFEVIIVDDGSTDDTLEIIEYKTKNSKNFRIIKNKHKGKAWAVITGLSDSKGEIALFTDMDQATPLAEIEKLIPKFKEGFDVVIGSRFSRKNAPIVRRFAAKAFSIIRNIILGLPYTDTQCGFKAFNTKARTVILAKIKSNWKRKNIKSAAVNAGFDVEVLFVAKKLRLKIAEVKVDWHHVGTERVQIIKDSIDAICDLLRIKINDLLGKYN